MGTSTPLHLQYFFLPLLVSSYSPFLLPPLPTFEFHSRGRRYYSPSSSSSSSAHCTKLSYRLSLSPKPTFLFLFSPLCVFLRFSSGKKKSTRKRLSGGEQNVTQKSAPGDRGVKGTLLLLFGAIFRFFIRVFIMFPSSFLLSASAPGGDWRGVVGGTAASGGGEKSDWHLLFSFPFSSGGLLQIALCRARCVRERRERAGDGFVGKSPL